MYLALAGSVEGPLLELAAGSGRLAVPLASAGREVVGLDHNPDMLDRARSRWAATPQPGGSGASLELVDADITTWLPDRRFGLVALALNSLLLLDRETEQERALATIAAALAPHGRAVIDIWLPSPDDLALYDGRLILDWVRPDEQTGEIVTKTTSARYSAAARTAEITSFFDAWRAGDEGRGATPGRVMRRDRISFLTATELVRLAEDAGLVPETLAGDYEMGPLADDSDRLVLICRSGPD